MADRALAIGRAPITITTGVGLHTLVAGQAGYRIVLIALVLTSDGASLATIQDGTTSLMDLRLVNGSVVVMPENNAGWLAAAEGDDLDLSLMANVNLGGVAVYRMLPSHVNL